MGTVHKFKRPPQNRGQFKGYRPPNGRPPRKPKRKLRGWQLSVIAWLALIGVAAGISGAKSLANGPGETFTCPSPQVVDGDTLRCGSQRVRLYGIDAPELPGHCRQGRDCTPGDPYASTDNLRRLASSPLQCRVMDTDVYGRTVALCSAGGRDLSCSQIAGGFAVRRYGRIGC